MLVGEDVKLLDFGAAREFADERESFGHAQTRLCASGAVPPSWHTGSMD